MAAVPGRLAAAAPPPGPSRRHPCLASAATAVIRGKQEQGLSEGHCARPDGRHRKSQALKSLGLERSRGLKTDMSSLATCHPVAKLPLV